MGSILTLLVAPSPLGHGANDRLAASLHRHVLDLDHAATAVERVGQDRKGTHQLVGVLQPQLAADEALLAQGGAPEAFVAA